MPKLYGKTFANRYIEKKLRPRAETRDAIIFEIDEDAHVCKCRIQGSDEYINAFYPRNIQTVPDWMKPGNAVRILHKGGIRGHMEVIGHGGYIPTPEPGQPMHPPQAGRADGVTQGLTLTSIGGLCLTIAPGTYYIDDVEYTADGNESGYPLMDEASAPMTMTELYPPADMGDPAGLNYELMDESNPPWTISEADPPATIGSSGGIFCVDPIGNNLWRYDTFQIGIDGIIDYVKGTAVGGTPSYPLIDAGHVQIHDYILVYNYGGISGIDDGNVGNIYSTPHLTKLDIDVACGKDDSPLDYEGDMAHWTLAWGSPVAPPPVGTPDGDEGWTQTTFTATVKDQYGYAMSGARTFTAQMVIGTGWIHSTETGYSPTDIYDDDESRIVYLTTGGGSATFTYIRGQHNVPYLLPWGYFECGVCETNPQIFISSIHNGAMELETSFILDLLTVGGNICSYTGNVYGYTGWQSASQDELGDVDIDWDEGDNYEVTFTEDGDITFSGTPVDGSKLVLLIRQDSTGGWTPTLPASVEYGNEITSENLSIAEGANERTYIGFIYDAKTTSYDLVANVSGYE